MNRNIKYRFKTVEEFVIEYGNNWRMRLDDNICFITSMNSLLGLDIPEKYYTMCNIGKNFTYRHTNGKTYTIIPNMYKVK